MQTVKEDDLGHSPLVYILPVDRQVRRHGYISIQCNASGRRTSVHLVELESHNYHQIVRNTKLVYIALLKSRVKPNM